MDIKKAGRSLDEFILKDDEVLKQFAIHCDRFIAGKTTRLSTRAAEAMQQFFKHHVIGHFAYEERHIFPGLLRAGLGGDVARAVAEIRKDHRVLIKEVKRLTALLATPKPSPEELAVLREAMMAFGKGLQRHSVMENKLFPSLV